MKVMCIGHAAYDITLPLDHFPIENKKVRVKEKVECGGGSASNCAYLLAKWGIETYFAGVIGRDHYGDMIKKEFEDIGVNTKYLQISEEAKTTASYIIANTSTGTRTILQCKDEKSVMMPVDFEEEFDIILFDGYEKDMALRLIERNPKAIKIIDAGSMKEATVEIARLVDYVACSKDFAEDYSGLKVNYEDTSSIVKIYDKLKQDFNGQVVITLEDKGSFTYSDGYKLVSSIKVTPIDSTGAGDIYHGAFTYCLSQNYDLIKTLRIANITGALSVEKIGGRFSIVPKEEVMNRYDGTIS